MFGIICELIHHRHISINSCDIIRIELDADDKITAKIFEGFRSHQIDKAQQERQDFAMVGRQVRRRIHLNLIFMCA